MIYTLTFSDCVTPLPTGLWAPLGLPEQTVMIYRRELLLSGPVKEKNISVSNPIRLRLGDNGSPQPVVCVLNPTFTSDASVALLPYTTEVDELF